MIVGTLAALAVGGLIWQLRAPEPPPMPQLQGELRSGRLTVDGRNRTFHFYVPPRLRPSAELLLVLHGSMMNGRRMRAATGYSFDEIADREGILVAYPDGHGGHWNDCRAVGDYEAKRLAIDDVAFLRALSDWFRREYKVSESGVFVTGVSNGGQMSFRLALEAPDLVRGAAAIGASLPTRENQTCRPSGRPVSILIINGTDDPLNPYAGGEVALYSVLARRGKVQSTRATAEYWASLAGNRRAPVEETLPDRDPSDGTRAIRRVWRDGAGPAVGLLTVNGGGHTIPHPQVRSARILGRTSRDFSAPEEIWAFFAAPPSHSVRSVPLW